jgi:tripartite-type tricarboxylate transporter receptor subunit TctC
MKTRILHALFTFIACIVFSHNSIAAQTYPDRAIRLIVPFAPGGGTDFVARTLA